MTSYVQTNTIAGQSASGKLGYLFPTSQQPAYASRFTNSLENLAESGTPAVPFLSTAPAAVSGVVTLGRALPTPVAIQTPAAETSDLTIMVAAKLPNTPASGNGNTGALAATFYNSTAANGWNGIMLGIGQGSAIAYIATYASSSLSTQYTTAAVTDAQATSWGLYALRIKSSGGSTVAATIQAITAGTSSNQSWSGTLFTKDGETPTFMLGADYLQVFATSQNVELSRAFIWNYALTDAEINDMTAMIRTDLAANGITV